MFNRYWRGYPWFMQMIMLMLLFFTLTSFFTVVILSVLPVSSGLNSAEFIHLGPSSSVKAIKTGVLAQAISNLGSYSVTALLFAGFTHPRIAEYLGLKKPLNPLHWLLSAGIMLGILPVFLWGETWMTQHLHFGTNVAEMQQAVDANTQAFLSLRGPGMLAVLLFALAVVPAFGEELLFRGIFMRLLHRRFRGISEGRVTPQDARRQMWVPAMLTALIFALMHSNPYGFIFIFVSGCLLAMIYYLTGSLFCSILAHVLYNGAQIIFASLSEQSMNTTASKATLPPVTLVATGFLVFLGCIYALIRTQRPLPPDWSSDYGPGEV